MYRQISNLGTNEISPANNPLTYCLNATADNRFLHGASATVIDGQNSRKCQLYLSEYCANQWDQFCEVASQNTKRYWPNNWGQTDGVQDSLNLGLSSGEILIHNTAKRKYLHGMYNCVREYEPFDPNVASSPMISYWVPSNDTYSRNCVPVYRVDPALIDTDPVMNKILARPVIAIDILTNIYNTMQREGTLSCLKGTKLGNWYNNQEIFLAKGGV